MYLQFFFVIKYLKFNHVKDVTDNFWGKKKTM